MIFMTPASRKSLKISIFLKTVSLTEIFRKCLDASNFIHRRKKKKVSNINLFTTASLCLGLNESAVLTQQNFTLQPVILKPAFS